MKNKMNWKLKRIKVSELKEFNKNPRQFTTKGMEDLKKSISKFGIAEPIVCNNDFEIIGGHARKKTLEELGIEEVDVYFPDNKLSEKEIKELNIRLNKNVAGEFDFSILENEFEIPDLLEWGFEEEDFMRQEIKHENIFPFKKSHILISFSPEIITQIQGYIEAILGVKGVEVEQSSN